MRIEYHRTLIADAVRNDAFHAALKAVIKPGLTTVADIGAGTGLLGLMAHKLGAKSVTLYETAAVGAVAERILKANRARGCTLLPGHSTDILDPERADVVVSETLGNYAFEENIIGTMNDARARFLKPGGTLIPCEVRQMAAPVVSPRIHDELSAWDHVGYGLDLSIAKAMSFNNAYVRSIDPNELLDGGRSARKIDAVDFTKPQKSTRKGEARFAVSSPATIHGFALWWIADLGSGITLSTAPGAPRTHWEQLYFPLLDPISAEAGDHVTFALRSRSSQQAGTHLAWTITHEGKANRQLSRQALDLDKGYLP